MSLTGKRALVCGASGGIGREIALAFASAGIEIIALARRIEQLESLRTEVHAAGGRLNILVGDLQQRDTVCAEVEALLADGPIHILINNTGGPKGGPILDASESDFESAFGRHVLAAHRLSQLLVPGMTAAGYGRIINIVSTSVYEPIPNLGVSNTIRGAMASWAKSLSRELPPGVTINNVLPGFTDTPRLTQLRQGRASKSGISDQAVLEGWLAQVPEGRLAQPQETAQAALFLVSPAAAYIRGVSLPVDGGRLRSI
ncbi:MAG: SDR family oxidoreductase [Myxococcota bacterium]|nr:SDR family oxidoreductase [Myxococcota bacterium]